MKKYINMLLVLLLSLSTIYACHKDTAKPNVQASEYFPNTVGDYWEYDVYDSSGVQQHPTDSKRYTVKISIIGTQKLVDNKDATVWQYQYPWGSELNYVRIVGDTIKVYDTVYSKTVYNLEYPRELYIIPYSYNESWNGKLLWVDTYKINDITTLLIGKNKFDNCFHIFRHYEGPNMEYNNSYWFKPNIGMVKKYKNEYNLGPLDIQLWQLKKYYLQ